MIPCTCGSGDRCLGFRNLRTCKIANHARQADRIRQLEDERDGLRRSVLNQAGDNLCWLENSTVKIPPKEQFLESCRRYHTQLSGSSGVLDAGQMTIAQLEAELELMRSQQPALLEDKADLDWMENFILTGVIATAFELDGGIHLTLSTVGDRGSIAYREQNSLRDALRKARSEQS